MDNKSLYLLKSLIRERAFKVLREAQLSQAHLDSLKDFKVKENEEAHNKIVDFIKRNNIMFDAYMDVCDIIQHLISED